MSVGFCSYNSTEETLGVVVGVETTQATFVLMVDVDVIDFREKLIRVSKEVKDYGLYLGIWRISMHS